MSTYPHNNLVRVDAGQDRRRLLKTMSLLAFGTFASACSGILPEVGPPPRLFRLSPKSTFPDEISAVDWQLVIETPLAPAGLDTTRIALHRAAVELEYYARANWTDLAPAMIQTLVVESFENSGKIVAVGRESLGLRADFVLKLELREFQAEYTATGLPDAHVRLNAKIVKMPQRTIIGSESFEAKVGANADRIEDIVAAFDEALGKSLKDLVIWTLQIGQSARRA
ncbi:MAG: ABC-type transport auxiliary lipoprotein family protein [Alphaproteobacteria bacterium]|nr:ABC-type transport auxiliary lipoprotein family protein [Alphaproteobacteria bacterium]